MLFVKFPLHFRNLHKIFNILKKKKKKKEPHNLSMWEIVDFEKHGY